MFFGGAISSLLIDANDGRPIYLDDPKTWPLKRRRFATNGSNPAAPSPTPTPKPRPVKIDQRQAIRNFSAAWWWLTERRGRNSPPAVDSNGRDESSPFGCAIRCVRQRGRCSTQIELLEHSFIDADAATLQGVAIFDLFATD